jgi:hypothetical protein
VDRAWLIALGRPPSDTEKSEALALVSSLEVDTSGGAPLENPPGDLAKVSPQRAAALAKLCLAVFSLNEFIFID